MTTKTFCDLCGTELAEELDKRDRHGRLAVVRKEFKFEVLISKQGVANRGDVCNKCIVEALNDAVRRTGEHTP